MTRDKQVFLREKHYRARNIYRLRYPAERSIGDNGRIFFGDASIFIGVSTIPGAIALTVILYLPYFMAKAFVWHMAPAFDAVYPGVLYVPLKPSTDEMLTIRPK